LYVLKQISLFVICVWFFAVPDLQAQSYYFKNYQVNNGLSSNTITCSIQDKKGFMWFGSRNGLNRFDGNFFRVFRNKPTDPASIGSNSILSLYEDRSGRLWVGTTKGIYIYDPVKEIFRPFTKIPAGEVRYIKEDKKGNIWIVSNFVLYKYNSTTGSVASFKADNDETVCITLSKSGNLWTATGNGLIKEFNPQKNNFDEFNLSRLSKETKLTRIQEIYSINDSLILFGTLNHAFSLDIKHLHLKNIYKDNPSLNDVQIHTIMQQSDSDLWIGTERGLYVYNTTSGKTILIQKKYNDPYSITDNVIFSFCKDKEGNTWIGTFFGGINYYSKEFNKFKKYFPEPNTNSLSGNLVHEICRDTYGDLFIGTEDAGLNKLNLQTGEFTHFKPGKSKEDIAYTNIHGLLPYGNELWIGTYEHGLDVMNILTGKVIRHYNAGKDSTSLNSNFIVTIYKTKANDILIGTWRGMFKYNRNGDNFIPLSFFNTQVQAIHEDEKGTIWASTYGNGVYYYNPISRRGGILKHDPSNANSIINNYVNGLFEDKDGNFWFSTEGGISELDKNGKFNTYTIESGLPDNQTFRVLQDNSGQLWISTSKGLIRLDPRDGSMKLYKTSNGLLTDQFNYNSAFKNPDGTFYFGTVKGLISFKPEDLTGNPFVPPVYITGIQVNNSSLPIGNENTSLSSAITYADKTRLPYDSSNISFDVAALSYTNPEMNEYQYKMEGFDKDWTALKTNRKIYYTKLPPGDYTFKVKGSSGDGVWNTKETTLRVIIKPPPWATDWAYIAYFLLGGMILFTILRYYYIALHARNKRKIDKFEREKEREIYNSKIDFFTNIAHEIRTPLTLIKMPLDKLFRQESLNPVITESLHMIRKNTNRLIDLTNQLLDFRKAEANNFSLNFIKTDINELLEEMYTLFNSAADKKNINFKLDLPRITLNAFVDEEAVKKIIANLFNNAIKYAGKQVSVKLLPFTSEDRMFNIEFKNDGYLIPAALKDKIFEPFYRIKETEKEAGTGIGLPLARSLAELHKGTLEWKLSTDGLNMFLLSLPFHQEREINLKGDDGQDGAAVETDDTVQTIFHIEKPLLLLVEDNREILGFIQKELSPSYNIIRAYNGLEALELLQKEIVHLVISDIMMPVMDGIELSKKMKSDIQFSHIPIILLTAKNSIQSKIEGLEVGADAYIEKPFAMEHLMAQINNLLNNRNIIKEYFARTPLAHIKSIAISIADKKFIEELNKAIYENIAYTDLDVEHLSKMMNMSKPTLYRKIKGLSDLTPNELINLSRLKKAAELLAEGNYKINEIANMVGYTLQSNFSRDFNKQFGVTPSNYIIRLKSENMKP
jgi:ligand-binding sensor domain-containing protein/signal transduction histidine kinase/DNA-binding response OmpR family regulator